MGFEALLGNERVKQNLRESLDRGRISHFYLISGPEGSGKHTLARLLAAAILCRTAPRPCCSCRSCRKVLQSTHPDLITVDDPEKKTVPVDLIRQARADLFVRPNESEYKIYLFPRANDIGLPGQNALLKVLEEPPQYGVFLLLTDNPERLLPTVRSRCTELAMQSLPQDVLRRRLRADFPQADDASVDAAILRSGGYLGQAAALLKTASALPQQTADFTAAFAARDTLGLLTTLAGMEKWKRDALLPVLCQWQELLEQSLARRAGLPACSAPVQKMAETRSSAELLHAVQCLKKATEYLQGNVSPAAVCGYLEFALRE